MTTERQRRANQANARHSTGPRTEAGKATSSQNAITHGCYTSNVAAIPRGAFAEDQQQLDAFVAAIVDDLNPRDTIERCVAEEIAGLLWKARRLGVFEAEAVANASPSHPLIPTRIGDPHEPRERGASTVLHDVLEHTARIDRSLSRRLDDTLTRFERLRQRPLIERDSVQ
jgi:hypothetical protein